MNDFDLPELIGCARRELALRHRVYPRLVEQGRMSEQNAERELALMAAILEFLENHSQPALF